MPKKVLIIGGIVIFFIIIALAAFMGGGGGPRPSNQPVEIVWWKTFEGTEDVQPLIDAYKTINKNVTIRYVKKDINTYETELLDAIASGKGPDITTIHNDWLPKHFEKLAPAPSALIGERQYHEAFLDVAAADFIKEGKIYAVPLSVDVLALYYNKDILNSVGISEPPKTWPDVLKAVQKITKQDQNGDFSRSGIALGTSSNINRGVDILLLLMLQNSTKFYDENQNVFFDQQSIDDPDGKAYNPAEVALKYYTQYANPAKKSYTWNNRNDNSVDAFSQSKLAMMLSYSYMRERIMDKAPGLNWGVTAAPQVDNSGIKVNFANYWGEAVTKSSKNADVAWNFLAFISQKPVLEAYYAKHNVTPSRKDMVTEEKFKDLEIGVFAENALTAKSVYKYDADKFEGIFVKMIEDVVLRNLDPSEALRNAAQQLRLVPRK